MKCSDLPINTPVVFKIYSDIYKKKIHMDGHVVGISLKRREVWVCYLEGYKSRTENIPFEDMVAAYDENGEMMQFDNIKGKSVLLEAE